MKANILMGIMVTVALVLTAGGFYFFDNESLKVEDIKISEQEQEPEAGTKAEEIEEENEVDSYQIILSSRVLEQGDPLIVRIDSENEYEKATGEFSTSKIDFIKTANGWVGVTGIDARKTPGRYTIYVNADGEVLTEYIDVVKRNFPITKLAVTEELEDKGYTPENIAENIAQKDNKALYDVFETYTHEAYFDKPFIYPLDKVVNVGAFGNIRQNGDISLQHLGVDLDAEVGDSVYSVNDGVVRLSTELINYGNTIIVDHGFGIYSVYLHLSEFKKVKGDKVKQGEIIGLAGNTGYSLGPHLHLSIKLNCQGGLASLDPLRFIAETREGM